MDTKRRMNRVGILVAIIASTIFAFVDLQYQTDGAISAGLACAPRSVEARARAQLKLCRTLQDRAACVQRNVEEITKAGDVEWATCEQELVEILPHIHVFDRVVSPGFWFALLGLAGVTFGSVHALGWIVRWLCRGFAGSGSA